MKRITRILEESGFELARSKNHLVWKRSDGLTWTMSKTPSDSRAEQNALSDLRRFLQLGRARGTFGTAERPNDISAFEKTLQENTRVRREN
jgi:hypothetical protein